MADRPKFAGRANIARTVHTMAVPLEIQAALAKNVEARAVFEQLPPSHRREYVNWIASAKKPETVARRLEQLVPMLLAKHS